MIYGKSGLRYCITFIKRIDEGLRKQVLGKIPLISSGLFNEIGRQKLNEGDPGPLVVNYTVLLIIPEVESRTQGSRPRPRTQNKPEATAKDSLTEDRPSRGQGQGPRAQAQVLSKKKGLQKSFSGDLKKKVFRKIFQAISRKPVFQKIFLALHKLLTTLKIMLFSSRGQANF